MPMTSPVASASGLPCSLVSRRASSLVLASMTSAILIDERAALLDRGGRPGRKGGLGGGDGLVELVLGGARALRQHFFGGGIEDRHGQVAGYHFAVDEKIVVAHWLSLPVNGPFAASLYFIVYHVCGDLATVRGWLDGAAGNDIFFGI